MENNLKYIVYCTTNLINNKIYIGVHQTANPNIFDNYIGNGIYINNPSTYEHCKTYFQSAVKKYGVKNFKRVIIKIFNNEDDAYSLEEEIVNEEFLKRTDVYNLSLGGKCGGQIVQRIPIYQYSESGEFIREYKSILEASLLINRSLRSIQRALSNKHKCGGYFWTKEKYDILDISKMYKYEGPQTIPVFQYSLTGEYECCYNSIKDAARVLGASSSNLSVAIRSGGICKGKKFLTAFSSRYCDANSVRINSTEIHQYTLEGKYIQSFKNMADAKRTLGIKSDIYKAIRLNRTAGNFQWRFEKLDEIAPAQPKAGKARKVGKYDKNWNLLETYKSLAECKRINGSGMSHVISGRDQFHKGFRYKYID